MSKLGFSTLASIRALAIAEARPGERVIPHAESAIVPCGCEHHQCCGVPCTVVGRTEDVRLDRCLVCWTVWRSVDYAWEQTEVVCFGPASRGAPRALDGRQSRPQTRCTDRAAARQEPADDDSLQLKRGVCYR